MTSTRFLPTAASFSARGVLVLAVSMLLGTSLRAEEWDAEYTFDVKPGQTITFALDAGGDVKLRGDESATQRGEARIEIDVEGRDAEFVEITARETPQGLLVASRSTHPKKWRRSIDIDVIVPTTFDVKLDSNGGDFEVQHLNGEMVVNSRGGSLSLEDSAGTIKLNTLGGEIRIERSSLNGTASTSGGDVGLQKVAGELSVRTLGGDMSYDGAGAASAEGSLRFETYGGDIRVVGATGGAWVHTKGGEIRVVDTDGDIDAETLGGDIWIESREGNVRARTTAGEIDVKKTAGGDIRIDATGGEVSLTLPADYSMALEAHLAGGDFDSDFEIKAEGPMRFGTGRTEIRGQYGGGEHRVEIRTAHSDVRIKKKG